jgi:WD40 repeat protein
LYDPVAGTFSAATGSLNLARSNHTATLLSDGKVLIVGGMGNSGALTSAELYDPVAGTFSAATGSLNTARYNHTATLLSDGKVLIAGGNDNGGAVIASAELYDPTTQTFSAVGDLNTVRNYHTATLLSDGKVLIAGGYASGWTEIAPSERFICTIHGAYQVKFTATGGEESYTYSIVDGTGAIDPVTGDYSAQWATGDTVVIEVTDNKGNRATRTITLNIS